MGAGVSDRWGTARGSPSRGGKPFGRGGLDASVPLEVTPERRVWASQPLPTKEKHYVEVVSSTDREGRITPLRIIWDDGTCYDITEITACNRSYSRAARRLVVRYAVRVRDHATYLYFEEPRWFVEAKVRPALR